MRHFLRTIELIRHKGVFAVMPDRSSRIMRLSDEMWNRLAEVQPIVFEPENVVPQDLGDDSMASHGLAHVHLDAPFKYFSVEMLDGPICSPRDTDEVKLWIDCTIAFEESPNTWSFLSLCRREEGSQFVFASNAEGPIIDRMLGRLNKEKVGSESVREKIKLGTGQGKKIHTIRKIIHVSPKASVVAHTGTRTIDWTHRFMVRGHWRQHNGLGKDREGNYCVSGHTWVSEHIRGPEDAPLISKVRVVGS